MRLASALALVLAAGSAAARPVQVPVDVGVGPAAYWFFGPLLDDRGAMPHFGIKINIDAVIDDQWIANNRNAIPAQYQRMAGNVTELRISPSIFIPDSIIISPHIDSPNFGSTAIYGVTWRPLALGGPIAGRTRSGWRGRSSGDISASLGLLVTAAFIDSDVLGQTFFLRPGLDLQLEMTLKASDAFLISLGGAGQAYIPQRLTAFDIGPLDEDVCFVAQAFLKLHFRFPYETNL